MKILLDANFILACIKQKLDFYSKTNELFDENIEFIVPKEVLDELKKISGRKGEKIKDREAAEIGLEMIRLIKPKIISLNTDNVDKGIINYINKNKIVLATLDKELKNKVSGRILTIRDKKSLEII